MKKIFVVISLLIFSIIIYYTVEVLYARSETKKIVGNYYSTGKIELKIDELANRQKEILVKVQDPNFYNHKGVEFSTPGSGWTTITQSLAKKFYFKNFKQGIRKIKQTLCARYALDPLVDKDTQLELFINIIYFGNDCYGLKEASEYYFGKNPIDLTENEYISLIASLIAPSTINIKDNEKENKIRVDRIKKVLSGEYKVENVFDILYDK